MKKLYSLGILMLSGIILCAQNKDGSPYQGIKIETSHAGQTVQKYGSNSQPVEKAMGGCGSVTNYACGDDAAGLSTIGEGNGLDSTDCQAGFDLSGGEDYYFSVTASDASTTQITVCFENWVDDDQYAELILLGTSCATGYATSCMQSAQWTTPQNGMGAGSGGGFSGGNDNCAFFSVPGAGTYYFVLDSQGDGVTSFDIGDNGGAGISCATSTFSFEGGCDANDSDGDGIATSIDGSYTTTQQTLIVGQTYTVCTDVYLQNVGWEWLDNVKVSLGGCWTAVGNMTPDGTGNDFHSSSGGDWAASYSSTSNEVEWEFTNSANADWGDGDTDDYNCYNYSFCFDGTIDAACTDPAGGTFSITCTDDGIGGNGATLTGIVNSTEGTDEVIVDVSMLIDFAEISGYARGERNIVEWQVADEKEMDAYVIFKSNDGQTYESVATLEAKNEHYDINKYLFGDTHPYAETFYKIKQIDDDGKIGFSKVIQVKNHNVSDVPTVVGRYDLMGHEVSENFKGVCLELYSNGEVKRVINFEQR